MQKPIKLLSSEAELYNCALKFLGLRARSRHDLERLLKKRCRQPDWVQAVLDKCVARGYLDDVKYAVQFARSQAERKRHGRRRVVLELKSRGIAAQDIEFAVCEVFESLDEALLVRQALESKLKKTAGEWTPRKTQRLYNQLMRAGFPGDVVIRELRRCRIETVREWGDTATIED
ncbi:MAG: regulatory protein RecX [Acidobacteriia bacterium]|nr:regulatory protein RecX [Terriglobia bacterium]